MGQLESRFRIFFFAARIAHVGTHHTQQISKAAVVNASKANLKCILSRKQTAYSCTPSKTGAAYAASGGWRA